MNHTAALRVYHGAEAEPEQPSAPRPANDAGSGCYCGHRIGQLENVPDVRSLIALPAPRGRQQFVYRSAAMADVIEQARHFARSRATVLLTGESGTGKELIARLIHDASPRATQRYVRVNCAALSETLMESELFGHERGAFTGATESRLGRFEWAHGGTILLDEISEIPVRLQAKLLRLLEEEEFQRVGSNTTCQTDVRVIATTNRDLHEEVRRGTFRADLFYRLNVLQIELPALRARTEDVVPLANYFLGRFRQEASLPLEGFTSATLRQLSGYPWPGNVRQLRNVIHRACILARQPLIEPQDLPPLPAATDQTSAHIWEMRLEDIERLVILKTLERCGGNKTAAAAHLGVTARTLSNKMKHYRRQGLGGPGSQAASQDA